MKTEQIESTESGLAVLETVETKADLDVEVPFKVSGVAIGEGDITHGKSGVPTYWAADVLRPAAPMFEGVNIVKNTHEMNEMPPADNVIGEVTEAMYREGIGIVFEGEIVDEGIARKIDEGLLDVSPVIPRTLTDDEIIVNGEQVVPAESIEDVRELGVVMEGASPSNRISAEAMEVSREALSRAYTSEGMSDTELQRTLRSAELDVLRNEDIECETLAELSDLSEGTKVAWGGPAYGIVRRTIEEGQFDDEIDGDQVINAPAALIDVHLNTDGPEEATGPTVGHKPETLTVIEEFPASQTDTDADDEAADASEDADEALATVAGVTFEDTRAGELDEARIPTEGFAPHYMYPGEMKTESSYPVVDADGFLRRGNVVAAHRVGCRGPCNDPEEHDRRTMRLARRFDTVPEFAREEESESEDENMSKVDLTEEEADLLDEADGYDDPVVMGREQVKSLNEELEAVKSIYAEALAARWGTDAEKISENFDIEALREEVEGEDGESGLEAFTQEPETGDVDSDGEADETGLEALEGDEREEAEEHIDVIERIGGDARGVLEKERERRVEALADLTDLETDEVTTEVL